VALVGWSLGGVIAREVAREHPEAVRCVVTYGTPVVGGPTFTRGANRVDPNERARITALVEQLDADRPIAAPVTALLSRRDGVVSWTACLDLVSPRVEHAEVRSTHVGMGIDPDVWLTVARALSVHGSAPGASGPE
jgi:pimeloyl-ACP methyl ester carboxylesterase